MEETSVEETDAANLLQKCMEGAEINNLNELGISEGISVWSSNQESLEEQALQELKIFVESTKKVQLEEGKVENSEGGSNFITNQTQLTSLGISSSTKSQEDNKLPSAVSVGISNNIFETDIKVLKRKIDVEGSSSSYSLKSKRQKKLSDQIKSKDQLQYDSHNEISEISSGSEYIPSECEDGDDSDYHLPNEGCSSKPDAELATKTKKIRKKQKTKLVTRVKDDGLKKNYKLRLEEYYKRLEQEQESLRLLEDKDECDILENEEKDHKDYHELKGNLKIPIKHWNNLYGYQKEGVKWLWKLHRESSGGILGDEMGLGKTVQVIVFLHSLEYSRIVSNHCRFTGLGPSIIVCPATVIHQWVKHFHEWCPEFRVAVLHQSGSYQGNKANLIKEIHKDKGIIITTYLGILKFKGNLLEHTWHYIILDEGHKIRNPTAKVSIAVKQLRTPHRLLLTGSPMQNNLAELWSLFDFTNPGMLGNLQTFQEHFAMPILQGGFANALPMQEATALSVATTLKDIISPYLLRRMKSEVNHYLCLPNKSEQVLFCSLTAEQTRLYKDFLMSEQVNSILGRGIKNWFADKSTRGNVLVSITTLRKICNHPNLYLNETDSNDLSEGSQEFYKKSGKMIVVAALLKIWKKQGHRVLLFTQGRAMISVFEEFLEQQKYKYLKMDGSTGVGSRQPLIDRFNSDESYEVFLLTTRVGGLGINLTGANRVIIYDPDWNPATDTQARERAWRIGQDKQVTIYRLLSAGTIEEKMYQRQVWKQLLSNKILVDPSTNKFFKSSDLYDLFSLQESPNSNTETANIFHDSRVKMQDRYKERHLKNKHKKAKKEDLEPKETPNTEIKFSKDKLEAMKNLAQQIAKSLNKEPEKKTPYQKELEEQRQSKLREKEKLKQLTPQELIEYNRMKAELKEDINVNRLDDVEANVTFEKALEHSENNSKLYHKLKESKTSQEVAIQDIDAKEKESNTKRNQTEKKKHKRKRSKEEKVIVDTSGTIDGMQVDGLLKSEIKLKKGNLEKSQTQDNVVLEYLFAKRGVSDALHHDSILENKCRGHGIKINFEAKQRAEKALDALKKSRLKNWSW